MKRALTAALLLAACSSPPPSSAPPAPAPSPSSASAPAPTATESTTPSASNSPPVAAPEEDPPFAVPEVPPRPSDDRRYQTAPAKLDHVVIKLSHPPTLQFDNLRCEGHNALVAAGVTDGEVVAERWRSVVAGTAGVFVLRDSIWSQQDHPYRRTPYALMMPPSWVTVAVDGVTRKVPITPPVDAPVDDDATWMKVTSPAAMFGSFPASDSMFREARVALAGADEEQQLRTRAARMSSRSLAADVKAMLAASAGGPEAVALAGARRIAASDRRYFGAALRFHRVIPIFVENPNTKELQSEGKGMVPPGASIDPATVRIARDAVYRRRLRDGDLALERYDLSVVAERDRAIELLQALIPKKDPPPGGKVWLWVTGRLDPHRKAEGENAVKYLPAFKKQVEAAGLSLDRLEILSKPSTEIPPGPGRPKAFRGDARWYRHRGYPYSVRLTASDLATILAAGP